LIHSAILTLAESIIQRDDELKFVKVCRHFIIVMAVKLFLIKKKCYQSKVDGQSFNEDYGQICSAHVRQEFDLLDLQLSDYWYNLAKWFLSGIHLHWAENYYLINLFHKILYKWYLDVNIILYFYSSDIHRLRIIKLLEEIFVSQLEFAHQLHSSIDPWSNHGSEFVIQEAQSFLCWKDDDH